MPQAIVKSTAAISIVLERHSSLRQIVEERQKLCVELSRSIVGHTIVGKNLETHLSSAQVILPHFPVAAVHLLLCNDVEENNTGRVGL